MLKKRIIPCLDIKDGRTVKGVNFVNIRDAGDPIELAKSYVDQGADELVFLDISATLERRKTLIPLVKAISKEINIPFTVGGGISTLEDAKAVIEAGADKVSINSAAIKRPALITELVSRFGSQCVVVAIDTKLVGTKWKVYINGGQVEMPLTTFKWALKAEELGAGEILLTSMNNDGTKSGFALKLMREISQLIDIPVIASGGAGAVEDFVDVFRESRVTGALAASVFHFSEIPIPKLKEELRINKIPIRS